ncbi:hypothetical protein [Nitrosomonas aestuarii]|uniref:Uncharacterized protein n=1 Tax=Nitrosomonas aestuarii TaxID=52441 RepID=A0A1I3ZI08_9PROT|nr:hypothetical protein [Nitrosomonas aestuarii]PTN13119.1 hypothetical protein C8R11_101103 [Nitrosomonas aestuarii]SFK43727.1 hypothetical protein SAMN05216302_1006104 [Nitrosomonas aestuarii]
MNDEQRRIIIRRISGYGQAGSDSQDRGSVSSINRWVALAIMIPVLALMAVLGVFFFTIFVALFSIIAVVVGVRIWWLRRKFQRAMEQANTDHSGQAAQSSESIIVEDAEIIEETTVKRESKKTRGDVNS